jgi:hypothetical protein
MMKHFFSMICLAYGLSTALALAPAFANDDYLAPNVIIERAGFIKISDGSSIYKFSKDGQFESYPVGISGRTMQGHWTSAGESQFTVIATMGWVNGMVSATPETKKIIFIIYPTSYVAPHGKTETLHKPYFIIDKMVTIPAKPPQTTP